MSPHKLCFNLEWSIVWILCAADITCAHTQNIHAIKIQTSEQRCHIVTNLMCSGIWEKKLKFQVCLKIMNLMACRANDCLHALKFSAQCTLFLSAILLAVPVKYVQENTNKNVVSKFWVRCCYWSLRACLILSNESTRNASCYKIVGISLNDKLPR